jgi:uncharacterized protein YcfJ
MYRPLITLMLAIAFAVPARAQAQAAPPAPLSPKAQLAADSKAASARYKSDRALCNDEGDPNVRLQCRRDAKAAYDTALASARERVAAASPAQAPAVAPACADCGRVSGIIFKEEAGKSSPVGMIAGGVGGALLGSQVGAGTGKTLATIGGAAAGAYAGKKIEEKVKTHKVWTVSVDYPNNIKKSFDFEKDPGFKVGDPVRNSGNSIVRQ